MGRESQRKPFRKKLLILVVVGGTILVGAIFFMLSPPPEFAPVLSTSRGEVIEQFLLDNNAFGDYLMAIKLIPITMAWDTKLEDGTIRFHEELADFRTKEEVTEVSDKIRDYFEKCQLSFDMARRGIRKDDCVVPEFTSPNEKIPYLAGCRCLARLFAAEGKLKGLDGDYHGAYENYLNAIRLGNDIANGGALVNGLVNVAIIGIATDRMQKNLDKLDATTLETVVKVLGEEENNQVSVSEIMKKDNDLLVEYVRWAAESRRNASYLTRVLRGSKRSSAARHSAGLVDDAFQLIPDNAMLNAGWIYIVLNENRIIRNLEACNKRFLELADEQLTDKEVDEEFRKFYTHDILSPGLLPNIYRVSLSYTMGTIQLRGTRLRAAVELYQRRHGRFPENLAQLVSEGILKGIPIDPYSRESFRYSNNIVYSVGPDREDEKGAVPVTPRDAVKGRQGDIVF